MITTDNYILKVITEGETYIFSYDTPDVWTALEEFWHEDYPDDIVRMPHSEPFPIDVFAMDNGKVIQTYHFMFNAVVFHAFFDHGHKADGPYTLDEFAKDIERRSEQTKDVTSFFYYMWNRWSEEECKEVFKDGDYPHFWNKWCQAYDTMHGPRGAAELFYMMLSDTNRDKLVARALECYDGMSEKQ